MTGKPGSNAKGPKIRILIQTARVGVARASSMAPGVAGKACP